MADIWYYQAFGEPFGPVSFEELTSLVETGMISRDDSVREGNGNWRLAASVPGLFADSLPEMAEPVFSQMSSGSGTWGRSSSASESSPPVSRGPIDEKSVDWYCQCLGVDLGPMPYSELEELARNGSLGADDSIRAEGTEEWMPARRLRQLALIIAAISPSLPPARPASPPGKSSSSEPNRGVTSFQDLEDWSPPPAPQAPPTSPNTKSRSTPAAPSAPPAAGGTPSVLSAVTVAGAAGQPATVLITIQLPDGGTQVISAPLGAGNVTGASVFASPGTGGATAAPPTPSAPQASAAAPIASQAARPEITSTPDRPEPTPEPAASVATREAAATPSASLADRSPTPSEFGSGASSGGFGATAGSGWGASTAPPAPPPPRYVPSPAKKSSSSGGSSLDLKGLIDPIVKNLKYVIGGVVAVGLVAGVIFFTAGRSNEKAHLDTLMGLYQEVKTLQEKKASDKEWDDLKARAKEKVDPMYAELKKTASKKKPALQRMLWCSKGFVNMIDSAKKGPSKEQKITETWLADAEKIIAANGDLSKVYKTDDDSAEDKMKGKGKAKGKG